MNCDIVIEGGGAKGPGIVGAICALEDAGFVPVRMAGTSAGAIVASLLAAGYTGAELRQIVFDLDFRHFLKGAPFGTKALSLLFHKGIYSSIAIESIVGGLLASRGVVTFKDLKMPNGEYTLRVLVSDITNQRLAVFPDDAPLYGMDPDEVSVAWAVRSSSTIPGFFRPVIKDKVHFVDGGLLSNFPIWTFDAPEPRWPTFGLLLQESTSRISKIGCLPHTYVSAILLTALSAHDKMFLKPEEYTYRTIQIPVGKVKATDFNMKQVTKEGLYLSGHNAATQFLNLWSWEKYFEWAILTRRNNER